MNKSIFVIIDPQNDFMDSPNYSGSLAVPGAYQDMIRLSKMIEKENPNEIIVTLDSHIENDIAHPAWWVDKEGKNPSPFTLIKKDDVGQIWFSKNKEMQEYSKNYVSKLEEQNKYELRIWPFHCLVGTKGHDVEETLLNVLKDWEIKNSKKVEYVKKGLNPKTEHYSGFKAEVELIGEKDTYLNIDLIKKINKFDKVYFSGEASSHCVKGTVMDYIDNIKQEDYNKVFIIKDCMSNVPGYEKESTAFFNVLTDKGISLINSDINKKLKL